jgi:gliding-associated putative ABC transporter substrate-binding component GldG
MNRILLYQLIIILLSAWLLNQVVQRYNVRIDLTEEKKYTLSGSTKTLLKSLDQPVFFEVFLEGDLPSNFERFQKSIGEMLSQFAKESNNRVQFKFTDPLQAGSAQARNQFIQSLAERGVQPTSLNYRQGGNRSEKIIIPGALASLGVREKPVNLLKGNRSANPEVIINQSIEGLEYELASAIAELRGGGTRRIGLIKGHGAPDSVDLVGFKNTILSKYELYDVNLANKKELIGYDVVIIGKPTQEFAETEKYLLDQYLMRGGNLVFFLDALSVNMDSALAEGTVAIPYQTNLGDMLFRYGIRVNQDFVVDVNSGQLSVVTGNIGNQPQIQMLPWPFFPVLSNFSNHPAVRNLDAIQARFVSTIDTVKAVGVEKIPLIRTSPYTKVLGPPVRVALNDLRDELRPEKFTDGVKTVGYLLKGDFSSLYRNRLIPGGFEKEAFLEKSIGEGQVIVISDGDIIRNERDPETGDALSLGVEPFTKTTYANETFLLNMLEYLTDDDGLIQSRLREVKIRPLDKVKVQNQKTRIQLFNIALPVILILIFGVVKWLLRKQQFAK